MSNSVIQGEKIILKIWKYTIINREIYIYVWHGYRPPAKQEKKKTISFRQVNQERGGGGLWQWHSVHSGLGGMPRKSLYN